MSEEKNELIPVEITVETLKAKIYMVRGQRVMLAADLAEIYGYSTKAFNQQVKNNIDKFEDDFRFQLTAAETADLRSKFLTANEYSSLVRTSGFSNRVSKCETVFSENGR